MAGGTTPVQMFPDLIDAVGKVIGGIKALTEIPKKDRDNYYETMDETYRLLDSTLIMVLNRLDDVIEIQQDADFLIEVTRLGNYEGWYRAERELRLCQRLRKVRNDTERIRHRLVRRHAVNDWDALLAQMQDVLTSEDELAWFLQGRFSKLSHLAKQSLGSGEAADDVRQRVEDFHHAVNAERQRLIRQERDLYEII